MNIKTRPFTQDEFQKLLWVAPDPWRSIFQIAYLTGLRISDLLEIPYSEQKQGRGVFCFNGKILVHQRCFDYLRGHKKQR